MAIAVGTELAFKDVVQQRSGEDIHGCFYCQKCTIGCPTAYMMDFKPAQLLRLIQLGQKDGVLGSSAIWMCVACETCGARCPNQIRLAPVFDVLRQMALEEKHKPNPSVFALHQSFLDGIRLFGRVFELGVIIEQKARLFFLKPPLVFKGLISDLLMGVGLIIKGKISLLPERTKNLGDVKKLYEKAGE
jgi:heterodisulfide reductase subunit C